MKTGDLVWIESGGQRVEATVFLVSSGEDSLALKFEGIFLDYVRWVALRRAPDGKYRDLVGDRTVKVEAKRQV
jgi:hypothetical protein